MYTSCASYSEAQESIFAEPEGGTLAEQENPSLNDTVETDAETVASVESDTPEDPATMPDPDETEADLIEGLGISGGILKYEDVHGHVFRTEVHEDWPMNEYDNSLFVMEDGRMTYRSDEYTFRRGIDVYNAYGEIDWNAVKADGYDFAIIRAGYRGYALPELVIDENLYSYMHGAVNAGLDLGLYFFSQAITEEEAVEEAEFVLDLLDRQGCRPENLVMGVAYDPESIGKWDARTNGLSKDQATKNAVAFCTKISEAGFKALVYSNMVWEDRFFDLSAFENFEIWYADYTAYPQTPYAFSIWQYGHGTSAGVEGAVDVNIQLVPVSGQEEQAETIETEPATETDSEQTT